uniref:G-protein coupled receptors family 2 profile 1 domain-containing protein n=1 Tax=Amphimedon queenslandica TaxID=400682 RepID=A0A1X7SYM9_AMPQE
VRFCNESYTTSSTYGNHTWPSTSGSYAVLFCNFCSGYVIRFCHSTGWDAPIYSQCGGLAGGTLVIFDVINNFSFVRESYTINQRYVIVLICGIHGSSSPTREEFKWFDSNGNEVQNLSEFINSSFTSTNDGRRLLNGGFSIADFKGLYSHHESNVAYLVSYLDFDRKDDFILPGTSISGTYTCRSLCRHHSQEISLNTRDPSGPFSQFFFRFTAFFANISLTDVDNKDYKLAVIEANIFQLAVVRGFNSTINPIRTISCHFVPLMEEDGTCDRVECDVREYPPNSSFVEVVPRSINTFIFNAKNSELKSIWSIVMSVTGFCNQSQTESLDFGNHTWPESVGNTILTMPCGNRPLMNVTRMCQTNGVGWENPDYSQCETSTSENETNRGTFQWPVTPVESLVTVFLSPSSSYFTTSSQVILPSTSFQAISSVSSAAVPSSSYTAIHMSPSPTVSQDICVSETIVNDRGTFQWPVTPVGSLANLPCPHGPIGARAIRQCRRNGVWDTHDISNCADPRITAEFASIADTNVTVENVVEVAQNLSEIVMLASQTGDQNENNLQNVSSLLIQTANLFSSPEIIIMLSTEEVFMTTERTIEILNSIQEWPPHVVATQSNNIVQSFERIVEALISQKNFTKLTIIKATIAFQGLRVQRTDFSGITFVGSSLNNSLSTETLTSDLKSSGIKELDLATISLPASISNETTAVDINLAFTLYTQSTLFPIRDSVPDTVVGSSVISASVDGIPDGTVLSDNVTVNLRIVVE